MSKNHFVIFDKIIMQLERKVFRDLAELVYLQSSRRDSDIFIQKLQDQLQDLIIHQISHWYQDVPVYFLYHKEDTLPLWEAGEEPLAFFTVTLFGSTILLQRGWETGMCITYWEHQDSPKALTLKTFKNKVKDQSHQPTEEPPLVQPVFSAFSVLQTQRMIFVQKENGAMDRNRYRLRCNPKISNPSLVSNYGVHPIVSPRMLQQSTGDMIRDTMCFAMGLLDACILPLDLKDIKEKEDFLKYIDHQIPYFAGINLLAKEAGGIMNLINSTAPSKNSIQKKSYLLCITPSQELFSKIQDSLLIRS